jgi:hypothetical protein
MTFFFIAVQWCRAMKKTLLDFDKNEFYWVESTYWIMSAFISALKK